MPQRGPWKVQREAALCFLTTFITVGRFFLTKFSGILFPHYSKLQISRATLKRLLVLQDSDFPEDTESLKSGAASAFAELN